MDGKIFNFSFEKFNAIISKTSSSLKERDVRSFICMPAFSLGRVTGAAALRRLKMSHDQLFFH